MSFYWTFKQYLRRLIKPPVEKVNFLVVGTQKAGSTALDAYLRKHPEIGLPRVKELHYFNKPEHEFASFGQASYHEAFNFKAIKRTYGEVTPAYLFSEDAPRRIYEYNHKMKIIAILRNPVDRAFSHWNMNRKQGKEPYDFETALRIEKLRATEKIPEQDYTFSYSERGLYSEQIRRYQRYFKDHNLLFIQYDDLKNKPELVCNEICKFLNVKPFYSPLETKHQLIYPEQIKPETQKTLRAYFETDIRETERLLQWDCSAWL